MEVFIGTILQFGFSFAPSQWSFAQGQTIGISQNQALFALIGTNFGGNGSTTFQLPDLRGRVVIGQGQGPGLPVYTVGEVGGLDNVSLNISNLPSHTHPATFTPSGGGGGTAVTVQALTGVPTASLTNSPAQGSFLANASPSAGAGAVKIYAPAGSGTAVNLGGVSGGGGGGITGGTVTNANVGNNLPFSIVQPYIVLNPCIALFGIFPSRN